MHFGYPFCHEGDLPDVEFGIHSCDLFAQPKFKFQAHVAPLGIKFYTGDMFPEYYRNGAFVALHGSWNRSKRVGYEVYFFKIENREIVASEIFADGWLENEVRLGRPVDVTQLPDGSILISDDQNGYVYRVTYQNEE